MVKLLDCETLLRSPIVANCAMNRQRGIAGSNGYGRELGLDAVVWLRDRARVRAVTWVDLCCGSGKALIEAAEQLAESGDAGRVQIEGIDLAGIFAPHESSPSLTLREGPVEAWLPREPLDLVTCVHGLHYVGDKLALLAKAAEHLAADGLLLANLDLANFRRADGQPAGRLVAARLRRAGFTYDSRRRLVRCEGRRHADFGLRYVGADDAAGPNYTGQPAVASLYEPIS